jgi:hypothetical protein
MVGRAWMVSLDTITPDSADSTVQTGIVCHCRTNADNNSVMARSQMPFTTLTFATSLDSSLALSPGARTVLSGPQSKAMMWWQVGL